METITQGYLFDKFKPGTKVVWVNANHKVMRGEVLRLYEDSGEVRCELFYIVNGQRFHASPHVSRVGIE